MAEGFTTSRATKILTSNITTKTYVCLSSTTPTKTGGNFSEPAETAGYVRKAIGPLNTSIAAQIANDEIVFIFEALEDCGSITHLGLADSNVIGSEVFLTAKLTNALSVGAGYVPLIRKNKLVIGLDKEALESYA